MGQRLRRSCIFYADAILSLASPQLFAIYTNQWKAHLSLKKLPLCCFLEFISHHKLKVITKEK